MNNKNNAKYTFFYFLSLFALVALAVSTGAVIFQLINKGIVDIIDNYRTNYNLEVLKSAISTIIIATPVYYLAAFQINKALISEDLDKDSWVRRWLSYFVLFVSSVVAVIWLIITVNTLLDGDLTSKFILKALTAIGISGTVFSYYFYDLKRQVIVKGSKFVKIYFFGSLLIVLGSLVAGLFLVESPKEARARKIDEQLVQNFSQIDNSINNYYTKNKKKLPENLQVLFQDNNNYLTKANIEQPQTKKPIEYKVIDADTYELCAEFNISNKDINKQGFYVDMRWQHEAGYQCLKQDIVDYNAKLVD